MEKIGELAASLGINIQTLYFYERVGLLLPSERTEAGYRLYSDKDRERLRFIRRAKSLGLSLQEIRQILALQDNSELTCIALYEQLCRKVEQLNQQITELQALREQLTSLAAECGQHLTDPATQCTVLDSRRKAMTITVEVLGSGCKKCQQLEANAREAIASLNLDACVTHIQDTKTIVERGVLSTPALCVDGELVSQGKVLTTRQLQALFSQ